MTYSTLANGFLLPPSLPPDHFFLTGSHYEAQTGLELPIPIIHHNALKLHGGLLFLNFPVFPIS